MSLVCVSMTELTVFGFVCVFCDEDFFIQKKSDWSRKSAKDSMITTRKMLCYNYENDDKECLYYKGVLFCINTLTH